MTETYISCSAEDGSEKMLCVKAGLQLQQRATNGSPFIVVAEFMASSWEEASQKHYDLNGWGRYTPVDDATTARRKAMAEAMRVKDRELHNRPNWDAAGRWLELAEAADVAAQEQRKEEP